MPRPRPIAAVLIACVVVVGCGSSTTPPPGSLAASTPIAIVVTPQPANRQPSAAGSETGAVPATAASAAPAGPPVTVTGSSTANSDPFTLSGDYAVTITGEAPEPPGLVVLSLRARNDTSYVPADLVHAPMTPGGAYAFSANISGLKPEEYYLDGKSMPKGGTYTVVFMPK
jgi:hypothetical protein